MPGPGNYKTPAPPKKLPKAPGPGNSKTPVPPKPSGGGQGPGNYKTPAPPKPSGGGGWSSGGGSGPGNFAPTPVPLPPPRDWSRFENRMRQPAQLAPPLPTPIFGIGNMPPARMPGNLLSRFNAPALSLLPPARMPGAGPVVPGIFRPQPLAATGGFDGGGYGGTEVEEPETLEVWDVPGAGKVIVPAGQYTAPGGATKTGDLTNPDAIDAAKSTPLWWETSDPGNTLFKPITAQGTGPSNSRGAVSDAAFWAAVQRGDSARQYAEPKDVAGYNTNTSPPRDIVPQPIKLPTLVTPKPKSPERPRPDGLIGPMLPVNPAPTMMSPMEGGPEGVASSYGKIPMSPVAQGPEEVGGTWTVYRNEETGQIFAAKDESAYGSAAKARLWPVASIRNRSTDSTGMVNLPLSRYRAWHPSKAARRQPPPRSSPSSHQVR